MTTATRNTSTDGNQEWPCTIRVCQRHAARAALLPQRLPDKARAAAPWWFHGQGAHRRMAAAAEQPSGPGPFACMAASLLVDVSTYILLVLPCPAGKGPTARPRSMALADPGPSLRQAAIIAAQNVASVTTVVRCDPPAPEARTTHRCRDCAQTASPGSARPFRPAGSGA